MDQYSEDHGLVFRSFVYLFKVLQEHEKCNFVLKASFLEIYNEKVCFLNEISSNKKNKTDKHLFLITIRKITFFSLYTCKLK